MKKWKITAIVAICLFVLVSVYSALCTNLIFQIKNDTTLYEDAMQSRYSCGKADLFGILRSEGIDHAEKIEVKHDGMSVTVMVTTENGDVLIAYGDVSEYERWEFDKIETESGALLWEK